VQAAGMAATAGAVIAGVPLAAYAAAVVASAAVATTRPAQSTLIPSVSVTPDQLTAANVVVSWVEAAGIAAAGLLTGVLISVAGIASVFAVCAGLGLAAALLVARLRVPPLASSPERAPAVLADLGASIRLTVRQSRLRLMLALLTAEAVVVGALDLLFVVLAISVLHRPQAWAGYLNSAYGVGAVLAADRLATRRTLRILELGAGSGSASEILLQLLTERDLLPRLERYLITEPNAYFRRFSQRKLKAQYPNLPLEWAPLDVDLPWNAQSITSGEFDLVYAVNVMHISKNLLFSLNEARSALAPNGWLVIGECVRPYDHQPIYAELMFQILESFTNVEIDPEVRPNPGFLTAEQWRRAFSRAGFNHTKIAPDIDRIREIYPHFFTGAISGQNTG